MIENPAMIMQKVRKLVLEIMHAMIEIRESEFACVHGTYGFEKWMRIVEWSGGWRGYHCPVLSMARESDLLEAAMSSLCG